MLSWIPPRVALRTRPLSTGIWEWGKRKAGLGNAHEQFIVVGDGCSNPLNDHMKLGSEFSCEEIRRLEHLSTDSSID